MQCNNQELDKLLKEEESKFTCIKNSGKYKYAVKVMEIFMRILSIHLVPETKGHKLGQDEDVEEAPKNVLDFQDPFRHKPPSNGSLSTFLIDRVLRPLSLILSALYSLKLFLISTYKSQLDYMIESWRTKSLRSNDSQTDLDKSCELHHTDYVQDIQDKLKRLTYVLDILGDPLPSVRGLSFVIYVIFATLVITMFYEVLLFLNRQKPRIDYLSFFFDSMRQKRKTRDELSSIISSIIESVRRYEYCRGNFTREKQSQFNSIVDYHQRRYEFLSHSNRYLMPSDMEPDGEKRDQKGDASNLSERQFVYMLINGRFQDLVQPSNSTSEFLQRVTNLEFYLMTILTFLVGIPTVVISLIMGMKEINLRVEQRLSQLTCAQQNKALLLDTILLKPLLFAEEQDAYNLYRQNPEGMVKITKLMLIEAKYLIGPLQILQTIEFLFVAIITICGTIFCYSLYVRFSIYSTVWLNQIEHQLGDCARLMEDECRLKLGEINLNLNAADPSFKSCGTSIIRSKPETPRTRTRRQKLSKQVRIVKALTISYLNFELYRRQQSSCRSFSNFLLLQVAILVGQAMILCYAVGTSLNNDYTAILLFITTYLVLYFDLVMLAAAHKMSQITRIMRTLTTLLARSVELSIQDLHILVLWRRQTIGEKEAKNAYASNLLGIHLSYDNIITFNGYLVIIWLALLKLIK